MSVIFCPMIEIYKTSCNKQLDILLFPINHYHCEHVFSEFYLSLFRFQKKSLRKYIFKYGQKTFFITRRGQKLVRAGFRVVNS